MNKQYKKINENSAEMTFTEVITRKEVISLPGLITERDAMYANISKNETICNTKNDKIRIRLKDIEEEIKLLTNLGIKSKVASPEIVVEEVPVKAPEVIVEEVKVEPKELSTAEIFSSAGPSEIESVHSVEISNTEDGVVSKVKKIKK